MDFACYSEDKEDTVKTTDNNLDVPKVSPLDRNNSTQRLVSDIDSTMQSALSSLDELSKIPPTSTTQQQQQQQQPPPDLLKDTVTHPPSPISRVRPSSVGSSRPRSAKGPPPLIKPKPKRPMRPAPPTSSTFKPNPGFSIKTKTL